jgi:hypothetical protein
MGDTVCLTFSSFLRGRKRRGEFFGFITKSPMHTLFRTFGNEAEKLFLLPIIIGVSLQKVSPMRWGGAESRPTKTSAITYDAVYRNLETKRADLTFWTVAVVFSSGRSEIFVVQPDPSEI